MFTSLTFYIAVYYTGPSPYFWGLLYLAETAILYDYKNFIPQRMGKIIFFGYSLFSIIIVLNLFGSIFKNMSIPSNIISVKGQSILVDEVRDLSTYIFLDYYMNGKSVVFIGSVPSQYYVYDSIPHTYLDIHNSNGYSLPYMLEKELYSIKKYKPNYIILDGDGMSFRSSTYVNITFLENVLKDYCLIDRFFNSALTANNHLSKIEVYEYGKDCESD